MEAEVGGLFQAEFCPLGGGNLMVILMIDDPGRGTQPRVYV